MEKMNFSYKKKKKIIKRTNEELKKIREDKGLKKGEFAKILGVTPTIYGRYESGTLAIPEQIENAVGELTAKEGDKTVEKAVADAAVATEIEVKKTVRKAGRKAKEAADDVVKETKRAVKKATLDIIIADAAFGLPDAGLEFSDAVTDTEGEGLVNILRPTVCMEKGILRSVIILLVFLQEVRGRERQVETVFQPRLLDTHAVIAITAATSLQVDAWCYAIEAK